MHHEEHEPRHHRHRGVHHPHEHRMQHPHDEEHFNDFRSRWGEPEPLIHLNHQDRHPEERYEEEWHHRRHPNEEWHDPRHNQYAPHRGQHEPHHRHHEPPVWRQQDVHFDQSNQRVENRWLEDDSNFMPVPRHHERGRRMRPPHDAHEYDD